MQSLRTRLIGRELPQHLWPAMAQVIEASFPLVLFLSSFLPRAIYPVARSTIWHYRAIEFIEAVSQGNWAGTLLAPHPGVITQWLAGIAHWLGKRFIPHFEGQSLHQQMTIELLPLVLVISVAIVLAYFLMRRIFDRQVAAVSTLLLAFDPFHISISQTLHVDALMSIFAMLSALWLLTYIRSGGQNRRRYIVFSGISAGLALLSKTPALFLIPYLFLCLGCWKLSELLRARSEKGPYAFQWRDRLTAAGSVLKIFLIWALALAITYCLLWPSMWVQPGDALSLSLGETLRFSQTPHPNPILFMGEATLADPGAHFYPVNLAIKTTAITFPFFFLSLPLLSSRKLKLHRRLALLLIVAFVVFFVLQMTLAQKKDARYDLPALQLFDVVAGIGAVYVARWLARSRRWLLSLTLFLTVAGQCAISIPRHPYYGTHYNFLFGGPKAILENNIVAGQEQGEGLDIAADYLNGLPMSPLLVVGSQLDIHFLKYFKGKTVPMTDDKVDYLVFARNTVVRGIDASIWQDLWDSYQTRQPKFVVEFDGVPYVWVYKVGPVIGETSYAFPVYADVGQDFRLLGYDLEPSQTKPGETVHLTLYWEAVHKPTGDYTVFTHMLDPSGQIRVQKDNQPQGGMYPTYLWDEGERVGDEYELTVAPDVPPGSYQIAVGMYYLATLERLPVVDRDGKSLPDACILIPGPEVVRLSG